MTKKVLVVAGGFSAERDVSLVTGKGVAEALRQCGYAVVLHDLQNGTEFVDILRQEKPDVIFNALHGNFGEDGEIQGLLDMLQIPYTHSGLKASALGMDKNLTKNVAAAHGIKVAKSQKMTFGEFKSNGTTIKKPYVVKPVSDGSSVGVFIVEKEEDKEKVYFSEDEHQILVEEYIAGKELTVAVIGGKAAAVTEMRPKTGFYDYKAKYTNGMTSHILPAEIPEQAYYTAKEYAEIVHNALGCRTVSRSDFRYNEKDGVVLLEINTNPGMTPLSLVPEQAKFIGMSYEELCRLLVENAACRPLNG